MHILQTNAYGGLAGMFEAYSTNMDAMEIAAYEFGGGAPAKFKKLQKELYLYFEHIH